MKKQLLVSLLTAASVAVTFGQGQFSTSTGEVQVEVPRVQPAPAKTPKVSGPAREGIVQMAIRTGQPIQLLNPAAPAKYGSGHDHATHDPADPGKPKGIALFAWTF